MSLRKAIDNKCRECVYDPYASGTWVQQVFECSSPDCPLYPVRPIPSSKKPKRNLSPEQQAKLEASLVKARAARMVS